MTDTLTKRELIAAVFAGLLLSGCYGEPEGKIVDKDSNSAGKYGMKIWADPETGCEYLYRRDIVYDKGFGGITARLDKYGKPICALSPTQDTEE